MRTVVVVALSTLFVHAMLLAQASTNCKPYEVMAQGRRAEDSVTIGGQRVPRTEEAVRDAWKRAGQKTRAPGTSFWAGERVLIYRDSQPKGTAVFDGCQLIAEQSPLPSFMAADSIAELEILPSATAARFLHARRGYQVILVTTRRRSRK